MFEKDVTFGRQIKGMSKIMISKCKVYVCLDFRRKTNLHLVRIFFATPTFDKIQKDEKATIETRLSLIGGTMGLFTGFSIISGIEIIYHILKGLVEVIRKSANQKYNPK